MERYWDSDYEDALDECQALEEGDVPEHCEVTVGELRRCYRAMDAETASLARQWSCDEPGQEAPELPTACTEVFGKCPELGGDTEVSASAKRLSRGAGGRDRLLLRRRS